MNRTLVAALVGLVSLAACQDDTSPVAVRHASMVTPSLDILVGSATDLGTLGGRDSYGYAVNILGEVVGMSDIVIPYGVSRPFLWNARDGIVDLGTFGGANAQASAINDLGQVVGTAALASNEPRAFLWSPSSPGASTGAMVDLGTLQGGTMAGARAINASFSMALRLSSIWRWRRAIFCTSVIPLRCTAAVKRRWAAR